MLRNQAQSNLTVDDLRNSLDQSRILTKNSPTVLGKELHFDTEESKGNQEEADDLDKLLQLNEEPQLDDMINQNTSGGFENSQLLNRHKVVKRDILNLPKPAPSSQKSLVENLRSFEDVIHIKGCKIFEPFFSHIWNCIKYHPLTTLRLKLSNAQNIHKTVHKCVEFLSQSIEEQKTRPSGKLATLQLRLISIVYKKPLYPLILKLKETIYEYHEKLLSLETAKKAWKQTLAYTRKVHGDRSLISKVRQNKAFEIRRQMNMSQYGHRRASSTNKSKYEEREQESQLSYQLAKEIAEKLLAKCTSFSYFIN